MKFPVSRNVSALSSLISLATLGLAASPVHAIDILKHKTEVKNIFLIYDLPGSQLNKDQVKSFVYKALTSRGDDAKVLDLMTTGAPPAQPAKMEFKTFQFMTQSVRYPWCGEQAVFQIGSSDSSGAKWGDESRYLACGYRYEGGYRVNLYASFSQKQSGLFSLGASLAKAVVAAAGLKAEPVDFIMESIAVFENELKQANQEYSIVEMNPEIDGKKLVADPLIVKQQGAAKQASDRTKRLAARTELSKLGYDASDRPRFIKAIQGSDEDVVALYVEAGAVDLDEVDSTGKRAVDYAAKPAIKSLLAR